MKAELADIQQQIRDLRRYMKACGIKRKSYFNAGLTEDERNCNARLFDLETKKRLLADKSPTCPNCGKEMFTSGREGEIIECNNCKLILPTP